MKNVVLIADRVNKTEIDICSSQLEFVDDNYFNDLFNALSGLSPNITYYNSPQAFLDNISLHKDDIVLSVWSGELSRNRKALIPSICESYGIRYVGADPYVHFISQDKSLAKYVASNYGIISAKEILVSSPDDMTKNNFNNLKCPIVVKPNQEGGSNGISDKSVVFNYDDAYKLTKLLIDNFRQPVLLEEYIKGREICVTVAGTPTKIDVFEADEIIIDYPSKSSYPIFGYEVKKQKKVPIHRQPATQLINQTTKNNIIRMFQSLGKVDIMRFDGKITKNGFELLELSPDLHLGSKASSAYAFSLANIDYQNMIRMLLKYADT